MNALAAQPPSPSLPLHLRYLPRHVRLLSEDTPANTLAYDAHGQLLLHAQASGDPAHPAEPAAIAVQPVPAFGLSAPRECLSLVDAHGKERAYIPRLDALPAPCRQAIETALALREFIPTIEAITHVSSFSTPSVWQVLTDRGPTELHLNSEDDIRRLGPEGKSLRITDRNSLQYHVPDVDALPKASRKLLGRFI